MRGTDRETGKLFSYASPESLVPPDHPLRAIRALVNAALDRLSPRFARIYAEEGRPIDRAGATVARLAAAGAVHHPLGTVLMQQISYNMLFRWFIGLSMDAPVWDVTVFTRNRDRLLRGGFARRFLAAILVDPQVKPLLSSEHFSVDGTLIEAWASMKSFRPTDGSGEPPAAGRNGERDFHGEKRSNQTHASSTDPNARLYKKSPGSAAKLCHMGHVVMENRNGLVVATEMTPATGTAEREAAVAMAEQLADGQRATLGADKAYDTADFVAEMRRLRVTPHVSQNTNGRRSAIDRRTTRHPGYAISVRVRKRIEEVFGWIKTVGGLRKTRHRGTALVGWMFTLAAAAYNVVRIPKLLAAAG